MTHQTVNLVGMNLCASWGRMGISTTSSTPSLITRAQPVLTSPSPYTWSFQYPYGSDARRPQSTALITINRFIQHISASLIAPFYTDEIQVKATA